MRHTIYLIAALLLTACGWMNDDEGWFVDPTDDYLDSTQLEPLNVPADMEAVPLDDPFPIPAVPSQPNPQYFPDKPPLPDAIYANDTRNEVRIQRLGDRRWLVIPEPPTTVWPKIKQFLAENAVTVVDEQPPEGRLDTEWFTVAPSGQQNYRDVVRIVLQDARSDAGLSTGRDRLRLKLEQGLQAHTSELHLRHENDSVTLPTADGLVSLNSFASTVSAAEDEMLKEIGAYIAARVSEQTVSKVATNIASTAKARMGRNGSGQPVLLLNLDFERAWAAVGRALENGEVEITDRNVEGGVYYVRVPESLFTGQEEPGFIGRMFGRDRADIYDLSLHVYGEATAHEVLVRDGEGGAADRELSQEILTLLRELAG